MLPAFRLSIAGLSIAISAWSGSAFAAGLYFTDRGVRPMGRAGAFVAGADDLGAIWYNPAGLADAGTSVLLDASWLEFSIDYTRALRVVNPPDGPPRPAGPACAISAPSGSDARPPRPTIRRR